MRTVWYNPIPEEDMVMVVDLRVPASDLGEIMRECHLSDVQAIENAFRAYLVGHKYGFSPNKIWWQHKRSDKRTRYVVPTPVSMDLEWQFVTTTLPENILKLLDEVGIHGHTMLEFAARIGVSTLAQALRLSVTHQLVSRESGRVYEIDETEGEIKHAFLHNHLNLVK
jgi:hypothetical protein